MRKQLFLLLLVCVCSGLISAQSKTKSNTIHITYEHSYHGELHAGYSTTLDISGDNAVIGVIDENRNPNSPEQKTFLNYKDSTETRYAKMRDGEEIFTKRKFTIGAGLDKQAENEVIAGYTCEKVKTVINSNTIEIWYTKALGVYGTIQPGVGVPDGVVLKIVRNGQSEVKAVKVDVEKNSAQLQPDLSNARELTAVAYNYKIQQSLVVNISVFDHESIYFRDIPKVEELSESEVMQFANGSIILRKVKLPENAKNYSIFAELSHYSEGDAYDRTGSVFMIPVDKKQSFLDGLLNGKEALPQYIDKKGNQYEGMMATTDYNPALELMRFYTSFGTRGYNHIQVADFNWPDSVIFKQEVTDYAALLQGEVYVGIWIGNYSKNGHNVTLNLKYYPGGKEAEAAVYPLFTTVNIMEMAGQAYPNELFRDDTLTVTITVKEDLKDAYIRYISTGHGGWGGGDEFNPKVNEIFMDGERLIAYTPWREDCGSYRVLNPASGNFYTGMSSSDYSRSGWCPGMVSYPVYVRVGDLKAGEHQFKVAIPVGKPEGNSISYWCISGVLVGEK
ncbi:hypothetical protein LJC68_08645 [Bacteroidales bacterium OttesenSCG-928-B11]|nr:hypothetical protein [Bacteroidales bacterium OttesenSCG-928-C03]MDL2312928.1 hypothetical protein [Bacteroidales bacterium OttesenSCG-928-B11]MDL2325540.1 hypothetical protein [Bacteroidales bacterium OttesenSCG-928-A14]